MSDNNKGLIFISYKREDQAFGEQLREQLQAWGWRTWMDIYDIHDEAQAPREIENGLKAADKVIAVMTPKAVASESIVNEWEYATVHEKPLILIRLAMCEIPLTLVQNRYIDFIQPTPENWTALETALNEPAADKFVDPYLPYLQKLYKRINTNLAQKVISRKDGNALLPNPLHLRSSSTPEDVDVLFSKQDALNPTFEADGIILGSQKQDYADFESAFRRYKGQVLLLGEPGSGKTITLLQFARDAVVRRIQDPTQRLPMFAILPDWLKLGTPEIHDWMAQNYDTPEDAEDLVRSGKALLLFDGLDELGGRAEEISPNNLYEMVEYDPRVRFMYMLRKVVRNPDNEISGADNQLVVTCRLHDYRRTGVKIGLQGAVILKKLDQKQIAQYLEDVPGLQAIFRDDAEMQKIAETPLLLSLIAYAFREKTTELQGLRDLREGALRDAIFNAYVSQRYEHERDKLKAQKQELLFELTALMRDLGWIAMVNAAHQNFASENVLVEADFWRVVGSSKSRSLITLCQQLNLITEIDATTWRFVHLKLRDTLAYGQAAKILKNPPASIRLFSLAGSAIINIKDKRLISEILTYKDDQNKLLSSLSAHPFHSLEEAINAPKFWGYRDWVRPKQPKQEVDPEWLERVISQLNSQNADRRASAAQDLGQIGDRRAVDALLKALTDRERIVRYRAVVALGTLRAAQAVDGLLTIFQNDTLVLRREAVEALGAIGVGHAQVLDTLIKALDEFDAVMRSKAAQALGRIGDERATERLTKATRDQDALVRESAVRALASIDDPEGIESLIMALDNSSRGVRLAAITALEGVGDTRATKNLLKALADEVNQVRDQAALALENIGNAEVVQGLILMLSHQEFYVRTKAAETLGKIGSNQALGSLLDTLNDSDYHVRAKAAEALGKLGDPQVVETLLKFMDDPSKFVRSSTAEALGKIHDARSIKPLLKALDDPAEQVRANAAKAIGIMDDNRISKVFQKALRHPDIRVRQVAVRVLAAIAKPWTTTGLGLALSDTDENIRYQAASALGIPGNLQAAEGLANALSDPDVSVRRIAAQALGRIGSAMAVEKLVTALNDADEEVWRGAVEALGRIGDADCLPQLESAANNKRLAEAIQNALYGFRNEYAFQLAEKISRNNKKE